MLPPILCRFYPGLCFAVPAFLLRVPFGLVEATLWTYIVYFIVGFSGTVRWVFVSDRFLHS